tara:strand:+ start:583 stop:1083 length:501 start_codon:yes stop_codon:yes gene_type:complete
MHPVVNILLDISKNVYFGEPKRDWDIINVNGVKHTFCTISYYIFMCIFNGKNRVSMIDMKVSLGIQDEDILQRLFRVITGYFYRRDRDIFYDDFHVFLSWAKVDELCKIIDLIVYRDIREEDTRFMEKKEKEKEKKETREKKEKKETTEKSWGICLCNELINVFRI